MLKKAVTKKPLTLLLMLWIACSGYAQEEKAIISFSEKAFNFGTISEENGPVMHEFIFKNEGKAPLIISDVKASCGCTTPSWTSEPILPGATGSVVAEYNPVNRPGSFSKTISVTSNAEPALTVLAIKGSVQPKPRTAEEDYPAKMGHLRSQYRTFNMGKVTTKEPFIKTYEIFNDSQEPVIFSSKTVAPPHIQVEVSPQELMPQQRGSIQITYNAQLRKNLGFSSDHIQIFTNEPQDSIKDFSVMATVEEYFPPMSKEELERSPRLVFEKRNHDFGEVNEGKLVKTEFVFTNYGKSPLNIRETRANCGCTISKPDKTTLEPGESSRIAVTFDSHGRRGKQHKTVTVFSNDPSSPTQQLILTGKVNSSESE